MGTADQKATEKYAWVIFFGYGVASVVAGIAIVAGFLPDPPSAERTTGLTLDQIVARVPGLDAYVSGLARQLGNFMIAMGVLLTGVAAIPFRRGERWAWYACWVMPILVALQLVNSFAIYGFASGGFLWELDLASVFLVLAGLLMPYRTFFPTDQSVPR